MYINSLFYLYGIDFKYTFIGFGPDVYLAMNIGRTICSGIDNSPIIAISSLGKPLSMIFKPETTSIALNPI